MYALHNKLDNMCLGSGIMTVEPIEPKEFDKCHRLLNVPIGYLRIKVRKCKYRNRKIK